MVLTSAQALYLCSMSVDLTLTGLVGLRMAPSPALATLPFALIPVAAAVTTTPASLLMARTGRRAVFLLGTLAAAAGGAVSVLAIYARSFPLFCLGTAGIGVYGACAGYYRYAAADQAPTQRRGRAISTVLAGGLLAAVAGPSIAAASKGLLRVPFAGSYLVVAALAVIAAGLLAFLRLPRAEAYGSHGAGPSDPEAEPPRPMRTVLTRPVFVTAVAGSALAYMTMSMLMTASPLAVLAHGHTITQGAAVVQWHLLGMFAPSLVSGHIIQRLNASRTLLAGTAVTGSGAVVAMSGTSAGHFMAALALVGIGWNLMFVAGSTLLTYAHRPAEKARTQGIGELLTRLGASTGALSAGALLAVLGWRDISLVAMALLSPAAIMAVLLASGRLR